MTQTCFHKMRKFDVVVSIFLLASLADLPAAAQNFRGGLAPQSGVIVRSAVGPVLVSNSIFPSALSTVRAATPASAAQLIPVLPVAPALVQPSRSMFAATSVSASEKQLALVQGRLLLPEGSGVAIFDGGVKRGGAVSDAPQTVQALINRPALAATVKRLKPSRVEAALTPLPVGRFASQSGRALTSALRAPWLGSIAGAVAVGFGMNPLFGGVVGAASLLSLWFVLVLGRFFNLSDKIKNSILFLSAVSAQITGGVAVGTLIVGTYKLLF